MSKPHPSSRKKYWKIASFWLKKWKPQESLPSDHLDKKIWKKEKEIFKWFSKKKNKKNYWKIIHFSDLKVMFHSFIIYQVRREEKINHQSAIGMAIIIPITITIGYIIFNGFFSGLRYSFDCQWLVFSS